VISISHTKSKLGGSEGSAALRVGPGPTKNESPDPTTSRRKRLVNVVHPSWLCAIAKQGADSSDESELDRLNMTLTIA
jgi:hypothetical protein